MCVLEAQNISKCREALFFGSMNSPYIILLPLELFGGIKACPDVLKVKVLL